MKNKIILALFAILVLGSGGRTQSAPLQAYSFTVMAGTTMANCPAAVASTTQYCFTAAGAYQSIAGAAYVAMVAPAIGSIVTSFNGQTGAVTYTPPPVVFPVTSVNGKTGAIVLSLQ